jgi:hypothetical protein
MLGIDGTPMKGLTPELEEAIAIVRSNQFTHENYQTLLALAHTTEDNRIGDMFEAFIASAPNSDFLDKEA